MRARRVRNAKLSVLAESVCVCSWRGVRCSFMCTFVCEVYGAFESLTESNSLPSGGCEITMLHLEHAWLARCSKGQVLKNIYTIHDASRLWSYLLQDAERRVERLSHGRPPDRALERLHDHGRHALVQLGAQFRILRHVRDDSRSK